MTRRRAWLYFAALVLALADGYWLCRSADEPAANITYAGMDSLTMILPERLRAARWQRGHWDVDPRTTLRAPALDWGVGIPHEPIAFVSLQPEPTFGRAIAVIRDLKRRRMCNVLIRELAEPERLTFGPPGRPERSIAVTALTLCGRSIGDAGFSGTLPADRGVLGE